ncbi:MAG: hypothetical protein EHM28_13650 [Spirochaetaceae bacterium]|nr:MAG: hypothetical protein EHM28_13650 [Spirochaetaceae bacterium]
MFIGEKRMKKFVFVISGILVLSLLIGCEVLFLPENNTGSDTDTGSVLYYSTPRETWTVMVHFAVDNNIDYGMERSRGTVTNYLDTLERIEAADIGNKIDIVVLMDCYNVDTYDVGYVSTFQDGYYHLSGGKFADDLVTSFTEVNSGSLSAVNAFLDWAITNYQSDGYMYSVFNHGSGFDDASAEGTYPGLDRGIGFDDSHNDCLTHHELGLAVAHLKASIGHNLDLFHAFACLMGGVELAYEIRDNADYLLFSEELFPAYTWSYEGLSVITDTSGGITPLEIGTAFCDSADAYYGASGKNIPGDRT